MCFLWTCSKINPPRVPGLFRKPTVCANIANNVNKFHFSSANAYTFRSTPLRYNRRKAIASSRLVYNSFPQCTARLSNALYPTIHCLSSLSSSVWIYCNSLPIMTSVKHCSTYSNTGIPDDQTVNIEEPEGATLDESAVLEDVADEPELVDLSKLTPEERRIHQIHQDMCKAGQKSYIDPSTGYTVLTRVFHIKKAKCCGNACRHCPYNHKAVPEKYRTKKFNSSFYS